MNIVVYGCGWLGKQLAKALSAAGHSVQVTASKPDSCAALQREGLKAFRCSLPDNFSVPKDGIECALLCFPPFWRVEPASVVKVIAALRAKLPNDCRVLYTSTTGVYVPGKLLAESADTLQDEYHKSIVEFEAFVLSYRQSLVLRLAGLVGPGRHPGRFLSGRKLNNPNAPVNLVHAADITRLVLSVTEHDSFSQKIYNMCASLHPTRWEVYSSYCSKMGLPLPVRGESGEPAKSISSASLISDFNFSFEYPDPQEF
ncbi:hypothetical protein OAO01_01070 [Oligoflexia bacterium]|nr:hypothetical protein [Oligoflexia bacterium]